MGLLRRGEAALRRWRQQSLTETGWYHVSSGAMLSVMMTQAATSVTQDDGSTIIRSVTVDWLIDACFLPGLIPQAGDRIEYDGAMYEVMALPDQKCWRWHGRNSQTYRIHTKQVDRDIDRRVFP